MGVLFQVSGLDKSGKTMTAVILTHWFMRAANARVFTNMHSTRIPYGPHKGMSWAQHITMDELLDDAQRPVQGTYAPDGKYHPHGCTCGTEHARITDGILLLDEAHTLLDWRNGSSKAAGYLTTTLLQCGKRNLPCIFTSHSTTQVMNVVRELTSLRLHCKENFGHGRTIMVDAFDPNKLMEAKAQGYDAPLRYWKFNGNSVRGWYDPGESLDYMAFSRSKYAGRMDKARVNALAAGQDGTGTPLARTFTDDQLAQLQVNITNTLRSESRRNSILEIMGNA